MFSVETRINFLSKLVLESYESCLISNRYSFTFPGTTDEVIYEKFNILNLS